MSEPDLRCYYHPEREATSQCDRCGDYLCNGCVNEHDELHVCARCLKDVRPDIRAREEIGKSAKIACVINAPACSVWMVILLAGLLSSREIMMILLFVSAIMLVIMSPLAVIYASMDMRGRPGGEQLFRWSVVMSACGSALFLVLLLAMANVTSDNERVLIFSGGLVFPLASIVLLGASAWKKTKPIWALVLALLAPVLSGACLLRFLVSILAEIGLV